MAAELNLSVEDEEILSSCWEEHWERVRTDAAYRRRVYSRYDNWTDNWTDPEAEADPEAD